MVEEYATGEYYFRLKGENVLDKIGIEYATFSTGAYHAKLEEDVIAALEELGFVENVEKVPLIRLEPDYFRELI